MQLDYHATVKSKYFIKNLIRCLLISSVPDKWTCLIFVDVVFNTHQDTHVFALNSFDLAVNVDEHCLQ